MSFVLAAVAIIVLDLLWIHFNMKTYSDLIETVQSSPLQVKLFPVLVTYVIILAGIYFIRDKDLKESFLFGCVVYGVYSFTNLSMFTEYTTNIAIIDTLWGGVLYSVANLLLNRV